MNKKYKKSVKIVNTVLSILSDKVLKTYVVAINCAILNKRTKKYNIEEVLMGYNSTQYIKNHWPYTPIKHKFRIK